MNESTSPLDVVNASYQAVVDKDTTLARSYWSDDATWHGVYATQSSWAGDRTADEYLASLADWFDRYPNYSVDVLSQSVIAPHLVALHVRTRNGEAQHEVQGLMLWRVLDGKIAECWALPGDQLSGSAF